MSKHTHAFAAVLVLALAAAGCSEDEAAATASAPMAAAPTEAEQGAALARADSLGEGVVVPAQRKLIQTAELHVEVASYARARTEIDRLLASAGGYVADARIDHHDGDVSRAELSVRVPVGELPSFLAATAGSGKVLHETLSSEDITEGYYDLKARHENAKRLEGRLLALMGSKANTVQALLEVERELGRVREEVERFEGKLRLWDKQVAMSTVKLQLFSKQVYAASAPPTMTQRLRDTFGGSWAALVGFGRGLLIFFAALIPWLLPLALAGWAIRKLVLRITRRYRQALVVQGGQPVPAASVPAVAVAAEPGHDDEEAPCTLPSGGGASEPLVSSAAA